MRSMFTQAAGKGAAARPVEPCPPDREELGHHSWTLVRREADCCCLHQHPPPMSLEPTDRRQTIVLDECSSKKIARGAVAASHTRRILSRRAF